MPTSVTIVAAASSAGDVPIFSPGSVWYVCRKEMIKEPFWERAYCDGQTDPFGAASPEVLDLLKVLPPRATVLDLGCGAGRNALPLARAGITVTAIDLSHAACSMLQKRADDESLSMHVIEGDVRRYPFSTPYDAIILHGVLHLLPRGDRIAVLARVQESTALSGINIVAAFTNRLPTPPDLAEVTLGLFEEGELFDAYQHWDIILRRAHTMKDEHPGGIRHEHAVNKIVAKKWQSTVV